ncbi:hypothetical protein ACNOYE_29935 [Nannocystaceae bacterium ST9]
MSTRSFTPQLGVLLVTLFACKGDPEASSDSDAKPDLGPKAKAANDEVPEPLKAELSFEVQEVDEGNIAALVPNGWKPGFMPGRFEPVDGAFGVSYSLGSNCDGACVSKDWLPIIEKVEFKDSVPQGLALEVEALGETASLHVYTGSDEAYVRAAWWKSDSRRYFYCRADLKGSMVAAKQAFASACKATHVLDWD